MRIAIGSIPPRARRSCLGASLKRVAFVSIRGSVCDLLLLQDF